MLKYHPYKSDKPGKKYYIITESNRMFFLGLVAIAILQFIKMNNGNKDILIDTKNNENWSKSGIDTAGFWSRWLLWNKPTIKESYTDIKRRFDI
jgi:hypothetical protein